MLCFSGSILNSVREPMLFSFALDKPHGFEFFCEPETKQYRKVKSVWNKNSF